MSWYLLAKILSTMHVLSAQHRLAEPVMMLTGVALHLILWIC